MGNDKEDRVFSSGLSAEKRKKIIALVSMLDRVKKCSAVNDQTEINIVKSIVNEPSLKKENKGFDISKKQRGSRCDVYHSKDNRGASDDKQGRDRVLKPYKKDKWNSGRSGVVSQHEKVSRTIKIEKRMVGKIPACPTMSLKSQRKNFHPQMKKNIALTHDKYQTGDIFNNSCLDEYQQNVVSDWLYENQAYAYINGQHNPNKHGEHDSFQSFSADVLPFMDCREEKRQRIPEVEYEYHSLLAATKPTNDLHRRKEKRRPYGQRETNLVSTTFPPLPEKKFNEKSRLARDRDSNRSFASEVGDTKILSSSVHLQGYPKDINQRKAKQTYCVSNRQVNAYKVYTPGRPINTSHYECHCRCERASYEYLMSSPSNRPHVFSAYRNEHSRHSIRLEDESVQRSEKS